MPIRRAKVSRKKNYRKKASPLRIPSAGSSMVGKTKTGIFRYVDTVSTATSTLPVLVPYSCNSIFDPYALTGGHQPYGFDQLTPIFERYRVNKLSVSLTVSKPIYNEMPSWVGIVFHNEYGALAGMSISNMKELPNSYFKLVVWGQTTTITISKMIAELMGVPRVQVDNNTDYDSLCTGNPGIQTYFSIVTQGLDLSTNCITLGDIKIKYHTTLYARNLLTFS